jgi:ATP-dependent Clp protease ATP-binding subunit ClpA
MYESFTDRARMVMKLANQEAQRFNHEYVDTEHILLGLVKEGSGVAAAVLKNLEVDLRKIRLEVEKLVQSGPDMPTMGKLPQTPRAKKLLQYAVEEARNLNHNWVGTEHLLLGMLREQEGVAAEVLLMNLGLKTEDVREEVLNLLGRGLAETSTAPSPPRRASMDPGEGQDHQLAALPTDVDYIQQFAAELATYCGKRESQASEESPEETRPPEVIEIDKEIERLIVAKEQAVANMDFEKASALRDPSDKLRSDFFNLTQPDDR